MIILIKCPRDIKTFTSLYHDGQILLPSIVYPSDRYYYLQMVTFLNHPIVFF